MDKPYEMDAAERFWVGPKVPQKHLVYRMQSSDLQSEWLTVSDGTRLDPHYSEFSVRIHDPKAKSLSFINRTIAIIPKSRLRAIYNLIGEYLDAYDKKSD